MHKFLRSNFTLAKSLPWIFVISIRHGFFVSKRFKHFSTGLTCRIRIMILSSIMARKVIRSAKWLRIQFFSILYERDFLLDCWRVPLPLTYPLYFRKYKSDLSLTSRFCHLFCFLKNVIGSPIVTDKQKIDI